MSYLTHLECFRCGEGYSAERNFWGCPSCKGELASNLYCVYDYEAIRKVWNPSVVEKREASLWRYREFMPVDEESIVTLGEGMTPLLKLPRLGKRLGLNNLYVKDESQNPTWSFKDRMGSVGASRAKELGCEVLTAASSGNGGAATAAYAARAGLKSIIFTTPSFPLNMRVLMQTYGSMVVATPTIQDRWTLVRLGVQELGWFPIQNFLVPFIGANPYAQEGCKALGFETCEQLGWKAPDVMLFPIGSGDTLTGAWRGCTELYNLGYIDKVPKVVGAEVFGALTQAFERGLDWVEEVPYGKTVAVSTGTPSSAYQSMKAVRESGGWALRTEDPEIMAMQLALAEDEGLYSEASSVVPLVGAKKLLDRGDIDADAVVVVVLTSSGLKDPEVTQPYLKDIPLTEPTREGLVETLKATYDYTLNIPGVG